MASLLRQIVAGPRARHPEAGLDLCYVTDNIIATCVQTRPSFLLLFYYLLLLLLLLLLRYCNRRSADEILSSGPVPLRHIPNVPIAIR